jgi:hypothetical protein
VDLEIVNAKGYKDYLGISKMKRIRAELVKGDSYSVKMDRVEKVVQLEIVYLCYISVSRGVVLKFVGACDRGSF